MFENPHIFSDFDFRTKTQNVTMKIHFEANKAWIFVPKLIKRNSNIKRENSNFIRFKVKFHFHILGFGAKIEFGEKVRIFQHCAKVQTNFYPNYSGVWKNYFSKHCHLWRSSKSFIKMFKLNKSYICNILLSDDHKLHVIPNWYPGERWTLCGFLFVGYCSFDW